MLSELKTYVSALVLAGDCLCISTCTQACLDDVCLLQQNTRQQFAGESWVVRSATMLPCSTEPHKFAERLNTTHLCKKGAAHDWLAC